MRARPLTLALAFAAGGALPQLGGPPLPGGLATAAACAPLAATPLLAPVALAAAGWAAASAIRVPPLASPSNAGAEDAIPRGEEEAPPHTPSPERLEGRVTSVPERLDEGRVRFTLRTSGEALLTTAPDLPWPLALGDRVRLDARLRWPEGPRNPGGRDRATELAGRGIAREAHAAAPPVRAAPPSPLAWVERGRRRFAAAAMAALPPREAGLVRAIGAGDRAGVDPATNDAFARSGLAHLLSVSGLHLAVVALGAYRALRWALLRLLPATALEPRRCAAAVALPITALYAVATGADVPVLRSALGAALALGGVLLDREARALDALALALLALLAADPGALLDASFQLSFASVAGLALGAGPVRRALPFAAREGRVGRAVEGLVSALCASVSATLATAPIVAFHFRRLSTLAALSNLAGVPVGSVLTVTSAAAAVLAAFAERAATPLLLLCRPLAWVLLRVNDLCAAPSWAAIGVGSPGLAGVALSYAAAALAWRWRGGWRAVAALAAVASLLGPPHLRRLAREHRGGLEVLFLSVGQGDATALLLPDGSAVVVDGGGEASGRYDPGARDVVPFLRDAGVRRIAALFASHPHPDHLLGLAAIAEAFPVERFFTNGRAGGEDVAAAWARLPIPAVLGPGDAFERAGVRFEVLGPPAGTAAWSENDASLVLRVVHGQVVLLLTGDVEREGEAALVARPGARLHADVVKIAHHGSSTSSGAALVSASSPRFAVAMAGRDNRFGFPNPAVVARWREAGAEVLCTAGGAVRFVSSGRALRHTPAEVSLRVVALMRERL